MLLLCPEAFGDVGHLAGLVDVVESLVGGGLCQSSLFCIVWAQFDVIEEFRAKAMWQLAASAIPCREQLWMRPALVFKEMRHALCVAVTAHEAQAGDEACVFVNEHIEAFDSEFIARVVPQVRAVASVAAQRTLREVDGEGHLVGNFAENDVVTGVFEHGGVEERLRVWLAWCCTSCHVT